MQDEIKPKASRTASIGKVSSTSLIKLFVLTLLSRSPRPLYGAEIMRELKRILGTQWEPSNDLLYNCVLASLERYGLVAAKTEKPKRMGWNKVYYSITPKGMRLVEYDKMNYKDDIDDAIRILSKIKEYVYR